MIRYEHPAPRDLLHVDVEQLGNIPAGGGWRFLGREQGKAEQHTDGGRTRSRYGQPLKRNVDGVFDLVRLTLRQPAEQHVAVDWRWWRTTVTGRLADFCGLFAD